MPGPSYFNTCKSYRISCMPRDEVPRRNGAVRENIPTSPMLVEYTTFMRGVDVADQLQASYSSPDFYGIIGYYRGEHLHYVLGPM
jgi:hypothetical protein